MQLSKRPASAAGISCAKEKPSRCLLHTDWMLLNGAHMARNGVWGTDIEILSAAASLLSTDVFVYTKIGDTYKWQKFS